MDPSYDHPADELDYFDDGLIQQQDLPLDDEEADEKIDETFGDDMPVGKHKTTISNKIKIIIVFNINVQKFFCLIVLQ